MTLTKGDLKEVRTILTQELAKQEGRFDFKLESQKDDILEEIDEKLIKFRSDLFNKIDPILKEVTTAREERPLIISRIEKIEKKLQIQTSA